MVVPCFFMNAGWGMEAAVAKNGKTVVTIIQYLRNTKRVRYAKWKDEVS